MLGASSHYGRQGEEHGQEKHIRLPWRRGGKEGRAFCRSERGDENAVRPPSEGTNSESSPRTSAVAPGSRRPPRGWERCSTRPPPGSAACTCNVQNMVVCWGGFIKPEHLINKCKCLVRELAGWGGSGCTQGRSLTIHSDAL